MRRSLYLKDAKGRKIESAGASYDKKKTPEHRRERIKGERDILLFVSIGHAIYNLIDACD